jgi:hypothetical protein
VCVAGSNYTPQWHGCRRRCRHADGTDVGVDVGAAGSMDVGVDIGAAGSMDVGVDVGMLMPCHEPLTI